MEWNIRRATIDDLPRMLEIFEDGRTAIAVLGIDQWQDGYPETFVLEDDLARGNTWLACTDETPVGTAALCFEREPSYEKIDGIWHTCEPYAALHRVAVACGEKNKGTAGALCAHLEKQAKASGMRAMRVDTHPGNTIMQKFLLKQGYAFCGSIQLVDGRGERLAYDKLL